MALDHVEHFDAVVIGAGFSGLYMLHRLREAGFSTRVYEMAEDVGGVWYWNRYPGARCDSESIYYNYTFSEELFKEWSWSSRFAEQPEILEYLRFVADKLDLRRDIQFNTRVEGAHYNEPDNIWDVYLSDGTHVTAKYFITGIGCLSASNVPNIKGIDSFEGEWYHTGKWPHEEVDFKGKRVYMQFDKGKKLFDSIFWRPGISNLLQFISKAFSISIHSTINKFPVKNTC